MLMAIYYQTSQPKGEHCTQQQGQEEGKHKKRDKKGDKWGGKNGA
jgi:hypothetical protein